MRVEAPRGHLADLLQHLLDITGAQREHPERSDELLLPQADNQQFVGTGFHVVRSAHHVRRSTIVKLT